MTGDKDNDKDLNEYLQGRDGISHVYSKASNESPPGHVDDAILAASRKAVGSRPVRAVTPFSSRWHIPVSIAAVLVLSVLLVFNIPDDTAPVIYDADFESQEQGLRDSSVEAGMDQNIPSENATFYKREVMQESETGATPTAPDLGRQLSPQRTAADRPASAVDEIRTEAQAVAPMMTPAPDTDTSSNEEADDDSIRPLMRIISTQALKSDAIGEEITSATVENIQVDEAISASLAQAPEEKQSLECALPRPEVCSEEYRPVCAVRDTGIRCVTTPCDSTEYREYSNACAACRDANVLSYTDGQCE